MMPLPCRQRAQDIAFDRLAVEAVPPPNVAGRKTVSVAMQHKLPPAATTTAGRTRLKVILGDEGAEG